MLRLLVVALEEEGTEDTDGMEEEEWEMPLLELEWVVRPWVKCTYPIIGNSHNHTRCSS